MLRTEIDAVNEMLSCIGEAPVNTLKSGLIEAETAYRILQQVSMDVQGVGWNFNFEEDFNLTTNVKKEIYLPENTLRVYPTRRAGLSVVQRGDRLYNKDTHSFIFEGQDSIEVNIVFLLPFEQLPHPAKSYITIRACRIFQDRVIGANTLHQYQLQDEQSAMVNMRQFEIESSDYNFFDNFSMKSMLNRNIYGGGRWR